MYEDLFAELESQIRIANKGLKTLNSKLPSKGATSKGLSSEQSSMTSKTTLKKSPAFPFAKANRFTEKNALDETQLSIASLSTNPSIDAVKAKGPSVVFPRSERFSEKSPEDETFSEINPDYSVLRRKTPFLARYHEPVPKKERNSRDLIAEEEPEPGPGEYYNSKEGISQRAHAFPKSERFRIEEKDEKGEINPNIEAVKKRAPTTVIRMPTEKNAKLKEKKRFASFMEIMAAKDRLSTPIENDRLLKNHVPQTLLGPSRQEKSSSDKKSDLIMFFHLADKVKQLRSRGPGAYTYAKSSMENKPCMVVYRSCSPVIRNPLNLIQKRPAPNQYNPDIKAVKASEPKYSFAKAPKEKPMKVEDLDWRRPLNLDQAAVKPRRPQAMILPEGGSRNRLRAFSELQHNRLGPGRYNLIFDLIEARPDIGVLPFKLTPFTDKAFLMDAANKEAFDGDLSPNYDFDKPKKPVFKYYEPVEWHAAHPSDNMLFRERWRFYDWDINRVRPEVKAVDFARNLNMKEYLQFEYEFALLEAYLERRRRVPELGKYEPEFTLVEKKVVGFDMEKMMERPEKEVEEKDELVLNPEKVHPKITTFDIGKQIGRPEQDPKEEEQLLLEPTYNLVDKKVPGFVDFNKQLERAEKEHAQDQELLLAPTYAQIDPKIKGNADFGKVMAREDDPLTAIRQPEQECLIEPKDDCVRPRVPVLVKMEKGSQRFAEKKEGKLAEDDNQPQSLPDVGKAYDAMKPEKTAMDFKGYSGREKPKIKISKKPSNLFKERGKR